MRTDRSDRERAERWIRSLVLFCPIAITVPLGVNAGGMSVALPDILLGALLLALWAHAHSGGSRLFTVPHAAIIPTVFVSLVLATQLATGLSARALVEILRLGESVVLLILVLKAFRTIPISVDHVLLSLKVAAVVAMVIAVGQAIIGFGLRDVVDRFGDLSRSAGIGHGGAFGSIPMTGMVVAYRDMWEDGRRGSRLANAGVVLASTVAIVLTFTRTWLVAAAVAIVLLHIGGGIWRGWRRLVYVCVGISLVISVLNFASAGRRVSGSVASAILRFGELAYVLTGQSEWTSARARRLKWSEGWSIALAHPLVGAGIGNVRLSIRARAQTGLEQVDNQWLDTTVKHGFVVGGLLVLQVALVPVLVLWRSRLSRSRHPHRVLAACYVAWLLGGVFWAILLGYISLFFAFVTACVLWVALDSPILQEPESETPPNHSLSLKER